MRGPQFFTVFDLTEQQEVCSRSKSSLSVTIANELKTQTGHDYIVIGRRGKEINSEQTV